MSFMIVDLSCDIFSCGTWVFVYVLIHVMCLCVYVSMVCQRCVLYDDMYSNDSNFGCIVTKFILSNVFG
jgi:hypothetical protein